MKVLAGIVLYNPDLNRLNENVNNIIKQVDEIILIDNNSRNIKEILIYLDKIKKVKLVKNKENKGIAYALNQILNYAYDNDYEWFITLDQDSVVNNALIKEYKKYININNIAMMSCNIRDRNYDRNDNNLNSNYEKINFCVTSGAFNNTHILKKVGGFDDSLFIDEVDHDICLTLRENKYDIIKINFFGLLHELGNTKTIFFLGKRPQIHNHSPFRTYYIVRNKIIMIYKHNEWNNIKERNELLKRIILILFFQKNKIQNFKAIVKGIKDSRKMIKKYKGVYQ